MIDGSGNSNPNYPLEVDFNISSAVVVGDIEGNANPELIFGSDNNYIYAFDASTGDIVWQYYTYGSYPIRSSPTIANKKLYHAATFDYTLYAFYIPE